MKPEHKQMVRRNWRRNGLSLTAAMLAAVASTVHAQESNQPPVVMLPPQDVTVLMNDDTTLSVSAKGTPPLSYQWRFNGAEMPYKTVETLMVYASGENVSGLYSVVVTNSYGAVTSAPARLTVQRPIIVMDPSCRVALSGSQVRLSVGPLVREPLGYEWYYGNGSVPFARGSNVIFESVQTVNAGIYRVFVKMPYGGAESMDTKLAVVSAPAVRQQWASNWTHSSSGRAMTTDSAGNILLTAVVYEEPRGFGTMKFTPQGSIAWVARYIGEPGVTPEQPAGIAVDAAGNVYVTGSCTTGVGNMDYITLKYAQNGDQVWAVRFTGAGSAIYGSTDQARAILVDGQGNVYVTGRSQQPTESNVYDYLTLKYDRDGVEQWRKNLHLGSGDEPAGMAFDSGSNIVVSGNAGVVKYGMQGQEVWRGGGGPGPGILAIAPDGSIYTAHLEPSGASQTTCIVRRIHGSSGQEDWSQQAFSGYNTIRLAGIAVGVDSNVVVAGSAAATEYQGARFVGARFEADGSRQSAWNDDGSVGQASAMAVDREGGLYVTGYGSSPDSWMTVKWNTEGMKVWSVRYPVASESAAVGIEVDHDFLVRLAGTAGSSQAAVQYEQRPKLYPLGFLGDGQFWTGLTGAPRGPYLIEASADLVGWTPLGTNSIPTGYLQFKDPATTSLPYRFYRATTAVR